MGLRKPQDAQWQAQLGFTYLKNRNDGLERYLKDLTVHHNQVARTDEVEDEEGRIVEQYSVLEGDPSW